jgi:hypothetical protein
VAAHGAQAGHDVGAAAGDHEFLFRADDQVELRQDALQMAGHAVVRDEARFAIRLARQAPQHGPVIDVEHGAHIVGARQLQACVLTACMALVEKCVPVINSALLDAMKAASTDSGRWPCRRSFHGKKSGEGVLILEAQHHQGRQAFAVDADVADVAAFLDKVSVRNGPCGRRPLSTAWRTSSPNGPCRRRCSRTSRPGTWQTRRVFQRAADLLGVQVHGQAAQADHVQRAALGKLCRVIHGYP